MARNGVAGTVPGSGLVPAPAALAGLAALGLVSVLVLPALGSALPWEIDPEPNASQTAVSALGILLLTAGYVAVVARASAWGRTPSALTFGLLSGIAVVKFVLSPGSFHNTADTTLSEYLWLGMAVMLLYMAGITGLYLVARRYQPGEWGLPSKAAMVLLVLVFAVASHDIAARLLGRDVSDYLGDVLWGGGVWLLVLLGASAAAAVDVFDRPERDVAFRTGLAAIVVYHGLWVVYMLRLFY